MGRPVRADPGELEPRWERRESIGSTALGSRCCQRLVTAGWPGHLPRSPDRGRHWRPC